MAVKIGAVPVPDRVFLLLPAGLAGARMTIRRRGCRRGLAAAGWGYVRLGGLAGVRRRYSGLCYSGGVRDAIAGIRICAHVESVSVPCARSRRSTPV
jgi:hypothetical protein